MIKSNENIKILIQLIDFTSLGAIDSEESLNEWVQIIKNQEEENLPAAICVYPHLISSILNQLPGRVKKAVVGGIFPHNQSFQELRILELQKIEQLPIDEVDVVVQTKYALAEKWDAFKTDLEQVKEAIGGLKLKIILETSLLKEERIIRRAAIEAIAAGADFLKTSTGKDGHVADLESVRILCECLSEHFNKTGEKIGLKISGGVRSFEDANGYYELVLSILGDAWIKPSLLRIGASSLYSNLLQELKY